MVFKRIFILIAIVIISIFIINCGEPPSLFSLQNRLSPTTLKVIENLPKPTPRLKLLVCPFTDSNYKITTDALQFYFPTVFKANWTPTRLYNAPFDSYVYIEANYWNLFTPGESFSDQRAEMFARGFGCRNYVTGMIDKRQNKYWVTLTYHWENNTITQKTFYVAEAEAPLLPGKLALLILELAAPDKITDTIKQYVQRPATKNSEMLQKTLQQTLKYFSNWQEADITSMKQLLDSDPNLDWFIPIYTNSLQNIKREEALNFSQGIANLISNEPRFQILYAVMLQNSSKYEKAIEVICNVIQSDPDNLRAREALADSILALSNPMVADPYYMELINLEPNSAYANLEVGKHKLHLISQYPSGFGGRGKYQNMNPEMKIAYNYLMQSIQLDPNQDETYDLLVNHRFDFNLRQGDIHEFYQRAQENNPNNFSTYERYQDYLIESEQEPLPSLRKFWAEIFAMELQNPDIYLLPVSYHGAKGREYWFDEKIDNVNNDKRKEFFKRDPQIWDDINQAYSRYFESGVVDPERRAWYGFYALFCEQYDISYQQFELSKLEFKGTGNVSYQEFLGHYCFAACATHHYDRAIELAKIGIKHNHCSYCVNNFKYFLDFAQKYKK